MIPRCQRCRGELSERQRRFKRKYCIACGNELHRERMKERGRVERAAERAERNPSP